MATDQHEHFMSLAIREAERGLYTARPNPRVGCVLVRDGKVISKGFHLKTGTAHAEANAIASTDEDLTGATAYVTLEPCSFKGRTASCAEALIKNKIARVVYAAEDPHPGNRGKGFDKLRAAGIELVGPILESSAKALTAGHFKKYETGLPVVRLKIAQSLDGRTALSNGESKWITGPEARRDVQKLRARSCAVVTGVDSVIIDDPSMSVRASELDSESAALAAEIRRPIVVLDSNGRMPLDAKLINSDNLVVASLSERQDLSAKQLVVPADDSGHVDLRHLLQLLVQEEDCSEVLFECGARLAGSVLRSGLVDELIVYIAPKLMGDKARGSVQMDDLLQMEGVMEMTTIDQRRVGEDLRLTLRPNGTD